MSFSIFRSDLAEGKRRPALLLGKLPGEFDDWLICMISSQLRHYTDGFDEIAREGDGDYESTGLKVSSVIRAIRLAVVEGNLLLGSIGILDDDRISRLKNNLASWLLSSR